jgi:hypothetical protein
MGKLWGTCLPVRAILNHEKNQKGDRAMIKRIKYLYHKLCAHLLNKRAAELSQQMRWGKTEADRKKASQELLDVGSRSNEHERKRDALKRQILPR